MSILNDSLLLLDGAMGTMLQRGGMKPGELSEMLNLTRPELIRSIHRAYIEAGSQVLGQDMAHIGMQLLGIGVGREGMQVGDEVVTFIVPLVLHLHEVTQGTQVVTQMQLPCRAYSAQNNLFLHIIVDVFLSL